MKKGLHRLGKRSFSLQERFDEISSLETLLAHLIQSSDRRRPLHHISELSIHTSVIRQRGNFVDLTIITPI
jgi:hypothetical protein